MDTGFENNPQDPQHPPDLVAQQPYGSYSPHQQQQQLQPPPLQGQFPWTSPMSAPQSSFLLSPEQDPPVNCDDLDSRTANLLQRKLTEWIRSTKYNLTPAEGKQLIVPTRNFVFGCVTGTLVGRMIAMRLPPHFPAAFRGSPTMTGLFFLGYPLGLLGVNFAALPSTKKVLAQQTPIGVQARYIYRCILAEKEGKPLPPSPFMTPSQPAQWGQYGQEQSNQHQQQQQQPFVQWNTFQPQPQYAPPINPAGEWQSHQHNNNNNNNASSQIQNSTDPNHQNSGYRSWDDIRQQTMSKDQQNTTDQNYALSDRYS